MISVQKPKCRLLIDLASSSGLFRNEAKVWPSTESINNLHGRIHS